MQHELPAGYREQQALNARFDEKLRALKIPFHTLKVFGGVRVNVHVTCISRDTARKWEVALGRIAGKSGRVSCVPHIWEAADQTNSVCLNRSMVKGWLIGMIL